MISGLIALPLELNARSARKLRCNVCDAASNSIRAKVRLDAANHAATHDAVRVSFVPPRAGLYHVTITLNDAPISTEYGIAVTSAEAAATKAVITRVLEPLNARHTTPPQQRRPPHGHNSSSSKSSSSRQRQAPAAVASPADTDSLAAELRGVHVTPRVDAWAAEQAMLTQKPSRRRHSPQSQHRRSRAGTDGGSGGGGGERGRVRTAHQRQQTAHHDAHQASSTGFAGHPDDSFFNQSPATLTRTVSSPTRLPEPLSQEQSPSRASVPEALPQTRRLSDRTLQKLRAMCAVTADGAVFCRRETAKVLGDADAFTTMNVIGKRADAIDDHAPRHPVYVSSARFKDICKAIKAFRGTASYNRGTTKLSEGRIVLSTILMKKTKLAINTATVYSHVVDILSHQHLSSSVVIQEHEFIQTLLELLGNASISALKARSTAAKKAKQRQTVAQATFGDNFVLELPDDAAPEPTTPQQATATSAPRPKSTNDIFSGDKKADAWMLY